MSKARDLSSFVSVPAADGGSLKLKEGSDNGSNFIELKSPASLASDVTFVLPNADGSADQALTTNGSGQLAWATVAGSPGGSDTQIQYNSSGSFAGASGLVTDGSNLTINAQGDLRFADSDSSNWVAFQAPATVASNVTWTLPDADGTDGQVMKTNGSGTLSWITPASGGGGGTSVTVTQATATASQTTFNVTYTVGQLSVYLNGALLSSSDYTASNGTSVVLASGAASGDIFTAVAYLPVSGLEIDSASPYLTAVGSGAGAVNTGANNTFVGFEAGNDNTSGSENTAVGKNALAVNTSGYYNTAIGYQALDANSTGQYNTALGMDALGGNTTGIRSTAVGFEALKLNTTGRNVALGNRALASNTTGNYNTALGDIALESNIGNNNTAVGYGSLNANTTGAGNTVIGYDAVSIGTAVPGVVAVGYQALKNITDINTGVGYQVGPSVTSGYQNIFVGYRAGGVYTNAAYSTCIGYDTRGSATNASSELVVAAGYNASGWVGKGSNTGFIVGGSGGIYQGNNSSSWSTTSDQRLKKNIVDNTDGLNKINALRVRNFEYRLPEEVDPELSPNDAINKEGVQLGVIAQEIQQVCPDCVKEESTGVLSVDSDNVFWHMVNAIKELSAKCDSLQAEINTLKGQ